MKNIVKQIMFLSLACVGVGLTGCGGTEFAGDVKQKYNICKSASGYEFYPETYTCFCDDNISCVNSYICDTKNHSCAECIDGVPRCENDKFSVCAYGHWMEVGSCDTSVAPKDCVTQCTNDEKLKQCINDIQTEIKCEKGCVDNRCLTSKCTSNECIGDILNACIDGMSYPMQCPYGCTDGACKNGPQPEGECNDNQQTCIPTKGQFICQNHSWMPVMTDGCSKCDLQKIHCACKDTELSIQCDINSGLLLTHTCKQDTWITTTAKCTDGCNDTADGCEGDKIEPDCKDCNTSVIKCIDGERQCYEKEVQICQEGIWAVEKNCSKIDNVKEAVCEDSGCIVIECKEGYSPDESKTQCVLASSDVCTEGEKKCNDEGDAVWICTGGEWPVYEDCQTIADNTEHAVQARCEDEKCIIDRCDDGYDVNEAQDACVLKSNQCELPAYQCVGYNTLQQYNSESGEWAPSSGEDVPICKKCIDPDEVAACVTAVNDVCESFDDGDVWISDGKIQKYQNGSFESIDNKKLLCIEPTPPNATQSLEFSAGKDEFNMQIHTDKTCTDLTDIQDVVIDKELSDKIYLAKDSVTVCFDNISQGGKTEDGGEEEDELGSYSLTFNRDGLKDEITVSVEQCENECNETHTKCKTGPTPGGECESTVEKYICMNNQLYQCNKDNNIWTKYTDSCQCMSENSASVLVLEQICEEKPSGGCTNGEYHFDAAGIPPVVLQCQNGTWEEEKLANYWGCEDDPNVFAASQPMTVEQCISNLMCEHKGQLDMDVFQNGSLCFVSSSGHAVEVSNPDGNCEQTSCATSCNSNYTKCYKQNPDDRPDDFGEDGCANGIFDMKLVVDEVFDDIKETDPIKVDNYNGAFCYGRAYLPFDPHDSYSIHREEGKIIVYLNVDMNQGSSTICVDVYDKTYQKLSFKFKIDGNGLADNGRGTPCPGGCNDVFSGCAGDP